LKFWFEQTESDQWFKKDPAFDASSRERFLGLQSRASGRKLTGRSLTDLVAYRIATAYLDEPRPRRKRSFSNSLAVPFDAKRRGCD
jgi:uncharacterized protein (DUF924 family)